MGTSSQISSVQMKLQTLDALPSLLNKVINTLNRFASIMNNASQKAIEKSVLSAGQPTTSPVEGEKNTNPTTEDTDTTNLQNELIDLLDIDVVEKYHNKKLLYNTYSCVAKGSSALALQALRRLGSIFTLVYAADQKLKKAYKVYKAGKRLLLDIRNKAISLGMTTTKVGIDVQ
ncbi:hypothetical protein Tco_1149618 [Tanacetum coccineum]